MTSSRPDEVTSSSSSEGFSVLFGRCRFFVLILSILCLTFAMSNSLALNFTVICMDDVIMENNATGELHWLESSTHINLLFSAIAIGCLIGTLPFPFLVQRYGIGFAISIYGLLSALATLLFPMAVWIGYPAVFLARVMQGIATSLSYPASGMIASQWATQKGTGTFIAILSSHVQFCSIFTMPVAGALCESSYGWRSIYYLQGILSLVCFGAYYFYYTDDPSEQRIIGPVELKKIQRGKEDQSISKVVPYRAICTDSCVLGIWLSTIGGTLGFQIFLLYGPTYMNKVLGFDVKSTGMATALPYILSAAMKFALGPVSDKADFISQRTRLIFFAAVSQGVMALCFVAMAMATSPLMAQVAYTAAIVFSGVNAVGTIKCAAMVFRQHVYFVMSVVSFLLCIIVLVIPVAVDIVCPNNTAEEWSRLFLGVSVVVVLASTPFIFVARDQPAEWTTDKVSPDNVEEKPTELGNREKRPSREQNIY